MQIQRAMRLVAVHIDGDCGNGDVREQQGGKDTLPSTQIQQAVIQKTQHGPNCSFDVIDSHKPFRRQHSVLKNFNTEGFNAQILDAFD